MLDMNGMYHIGLTPEHLVGNGDLGRYVLLPGDRLEPNESRLL